jgi:hypothetical protein
MTQEHLITPPPELVQQWLGTYFGATVTGEVSDVELALATQAARWGADQELEACCEWLNCELGTGWGHGTKLRAARRPKPLSLKEQALKSLKDIGDACESEGFYRANEMDIIRRALESLPE